MPADGEEYSFSALYGTCVVQILLLSMMILLLAYALLCPVKVTVSDTSLSRFALNGTALSYDLSLAVSVCNPNWAMRAARRRAPLRRPPLLRCTAGRHGALRQAGEGQAENAAEVLGSDGMAELVKETVAGEIQLLELKLSGYFRPAALRSSESPHHPALDLAGDGHRPTPFLASCFLRKLTDSPNRRHLY